MIKESQRKKKIKSVQERGARIKIRDTDEKNFFNEIVQKFSEEDDKK